MGDHQRRTIAEELFKHLMNQLLTLRIDLAGCFVKNQNLRITEDGTGQCNPLSFAPQKACSLPGQPTSRNRRSVFE